MTGFTRQLGQDYLMLSIIFPMQGRKLHGYFSAFKIFIIKNNISYGDHVIKWHSLVLFFW